MSFGFYRQSIFSSTLIPGTPTPQPVLNLSATALTFTAVASGANPANQTILVTNSGNGTMNTPVASVTTGSSWLSTSVSGAGNSWTVTLVVAVGVLPAGVQSGAVTISSSNCTGSPQTLTVLFNVTAAPNPGGYQTTYLGVELPLGDNQIYYDPITKTTVGELINKPAVSSYLGTVRSVVAGGDPVANGAALQSALNIAVAGDIIECTAGIYRGIITLPNDLAGYILVRTGNGSQYVPGVRRAQGTIGALAIIESNGNNENPVRCLPGTKYVHFQDIGFKLRVSDGHYVSAALLECGPAISSEPDIPRRIITERCYFDAGTNQATRNQVRRGLGGYLKYYRIEGCYFEGFADLNTDSQALGIYSGGYGHIENNFLGGMSENILFGGSPPCAGSVSNEHIYIRRNCFSTPVIQDNNVTAYGVRKNLFEIKNARWLTCVDNYFENSWTQGQFGDWIVFKANQDGQSGPDNYCTHILVLNSLVNNVGITFNCTNQNDTGVGLRYGPIVVDNALVKNLRFVMPDGVVSGDGRGIFQKILANGSSTMDKVIINRLTAAAVSDALANSSTGFVGTGGGPPAGSLTKLFYLGITNSILNFGQYGLANSSTTLGIPGALNNIETVRFGGNVMYGSKATLTLYPDQVNSPSTIRAVTTLASVLPNHLSDDYTIPTGSPYKGIGVNALTGVADGSDPGADQALIEALTIGCISGVWSS